MAERWQRFTLERIWLGLHRYLGACGASLKYLGVYPLLSPEKANRFCFGAQSLQDELDYSSSSIPAMDVTALFPGMEREDVQVGKVFPWEGSSITPYETIVLGGIIRHLKPDRVFEIGTSMGVTAYNLALNLPDKGELYTLDLPPAGQQEGLLATAFEVTVSDRKMIFADRKNRRFLGSHVESKITQLYGDSATFAYEPYEGSCDLVFVDGSHAYKYVKSDTESAFRLVKPGGWVVWHDYNDGFFWPDVRKYLLSISGVRRIRRIKGTMFAVCQIPGTKE